MELKKRYFPVLSDFDPKHFLGETVKPEHYHELITESCIIELEKGKSMVYLNLNDPRFDYLIPHLRGVQFNTSNNKTKGTNNLSRLVGAMSQRTNHSSHCNFASLLDENHYLHEAVINTLGTELTSTFKTILPQWYKIGKHFLQKANIHEDYLTPQSLWTSGIINCDSPHNYHLDGNNLNNVYSAMVTFKNDVIGGHLVFPNYGIALKTSNRSLTFFHGKGLLHGVSPIEPQSKNAYRYTIVLYAVKELSKCAPFSIQNLDV